MKRKVRVKGNGQGYTVSRQAARLKQGGKSKRDNCAAKYVVIKQ